MRLTDCIFISLDYESYSRILNSASNKISLMHHLNEATYYSYDIIEKMYTTCNKKWFILMEIRSITKEKNHNLYVLLSREILKHVNRFYPLTEVVLQQSIFPTIILFIAIDCILAPLLQVFQH